MPPEDWVPPGADQDEQGAVGDASEALPIESESDNGELGGTESKLDGGHGRD